MAFKAVEITRKGDHTMKKIFATLLTLILALSCVAALAATEAGRQADALAAIPGATENRLCAALIGLLRDMADMQRTAADATRADTAALSGMLRCARIEGFLGQREMMASQ
jgi:hypothetical protein